MVYEYNWIILSLKKRLIACNNMNETRENHAKWNKPERKKILCDFTFIWNLKILKQRVDEWLLAVGRWRKWGDVGSVQFSSDTQSCPTLGDPMNCSMPGLPVHHQLPEFTQTHVHQVSDAIQPSHPLSSPSPSAPNSSQHQSLFQWVNSSNEVAKVLEFQL